MIGPLLLDTCACMWLMANEDMKDAAVAAIDACADTGKPMYVSPISAWEVGMMKSTWWPICSLICFTWVSKAFSDSVLRVLRSSSVV